MVEVFAPRKNHPASACKKPTGKTNIFVPGGARLSNWGRMTLGWFCEAESAYADIVGDMVMREASLGYQADVVCLYETFM
jgi:hypothetical protein